MIHKIKFFIVSALVVVFISSCQKIDRPELGDYDTDDNQTLLPGPLRFFSSFDGTDGPSPRWNAKDSISGNPALLFPLSYEAGITGNALKGKDNEALLYLNANDFKEAKSFI